jgi:O-antigen ligase
MSESRNPMSWARICMACGSTVRRPELPVMVLALMMFLAPALGVPNEETLQDTLKSIVVSFGALLAGIIVCWQQRERAGALHWHGLMWLPLALLVWALGSMLWSHSYLGGVEAVRWFVFSLLLWTGLNTLTRERLPLLATGIHWGAVLASVWAGLQFWMDFRLFPQGAGPASTFLNRNFFAEFVVCTLPFSLLLAAQAKGSDQIALRTFTTSFNVLALMMTGTRSALLALLVLLPVLALILYRYRDQFEWRRWSRAQMLMTLALVLFTVLGLGAIPSGNEKFRTERIGHTELEHSLLRIKSLGQVQEMETGSSSVRLQMWMASARLIQAHPLTGVGAGAWEVQIPLYQSQNTELETDYYAHNEILQLLAEYGLLGWLFLLALAAYLMYAARVTWRSREEPARLEAPWRAVALACLLALLIVSNAGFPWRMASTGALFALCLAILAASDQRLGLTAGAGARSWDWRPRLAQSLLAALLGCTVLAVYVTQQALACESRLIRAVKMALTINASNNPRDPIWDNKKAEVLRLAREGIAINPHYRKITSMVADEVARWGDWRNATRIWESMLESRPYVVAMLTNVVRGHVMAGDLKSAQAYLTRAKAIQAESPAISSLEVTLLIRTGQDAPASKLIRENFLQGHFDYDMINSAYRLGFRTRDWALAIEALQLRNRNWPSMAVDGWLKIGQIYESELNDESQALQAYRSAVEAAPLVYKDNVRQNIPQPYRARL